MISFELSLKIQRSVSLLRAHRPADGKPYFGAFSGGKDSIVIVVGRRTGPHRGVANQAAVRRLVEEVEKNLRLVVR